MLSPEIRKLHDHLKIGYSFYYALEGEKLSLDNVFTSMLTDMK